MASYIENKSNNNNLYINITKIIDFIYSESFQDILIKEKSTFINNIENKILEIIKCQTKNNEIEYQKQLLLYEKEKESIKKNYEKDYLLLNTEYLKYKKYPSKIKYLKRFRKHCLNLEQIPLHKCSTDKFGKFIEVYENNKNKTTYYLKKKPHLISYLICTECSACYITSFIKMFCSSCKMEYYTSKLEENENENILPATWEEYHCKPIIVNEMMKCVKCENILYINLINKKLVCLNKKCNFTSDSQSIIWKCKICQSDFSSAAKIFNPLENKILQNAVFKSLLYKELCFPQKLYCCCLINKNVKYFHNKNCRGELYKGTVEHKSIVVCGECHAVNFYEKFIWICPSCGIKFYYQGAKHKKEIENDKYLLFKNSTKQNSKKKNHKTLYSLEKYSLEKYNSEKFMIKDNEKENNYLNNISNINNINNINNLNNNIHKHNFSTNVRLFNKNISDNMINNIKIANTLEYNRNTYDNTKRKDDNFSRGINPNNLPKYKYLKKKKEIKYKTLYEILEEREKNKANNKSIDETNNEFKKNKKNKITNFYNIKNDKIIKRAKPQTSMKKNKNYTKAMIHNYIILSDNKNDKNDDKTKNLNNNKKEMNNNIINISDSEEVLDKYNENNKYEYYNSIKRNLQKKLSGDLNNYSNGFIRTMQNDKDNELRISNYNKIYSKNPKKYIINNNKLTIEDRDKNNKSLNNLFSNIYHRNKDNKLYKESNNSLTKMINKQNNSLNKELENKNYENDTLIKKIKRARKFYKHSREKNELHNKKIEEDNIEKNNEENNSIYNSNRLNQNQIFKKIFLNRMQNSFIENKENNIITEEEEINNFLLNKNNEMEICQFGDIGESLVTKDDFMKIANECKIPSFNDNNITYIEPIGQGSYGVIYAVEEKNSKKQYALKRVLCNDIEQIIKHKKEFELSFSLDHPNLIKIYNVLFKYLDMTTYSLFVLMEKAETDWNTEIEKRKKIKDYYTEKELINIMKQLVNVLYYFQKNNVAHRDIKPQNILICANDIYKITDLGEAKNTRNNNQLATFKGSHFFMSPNLFFAFKNNDGNIKKVRHNIFKSDVFSLGYCFLYAMSLELKLIKFIREKTKMNDVISIIQKFEIEDKYSYKFMNIIYKMIQIDENKRCDFIELYEEINKNY